VEVCTGIYRPRRPRESPLFRKRRELLDELALAGAEALSQAVREALGDEISPGGGVSIATAGDLVQWHPHPHMLTTDGGFSPDGLSPPTSLMRPTERSSMRAVKRLVRPDVPLSSTSVLSTRVRCPLSAFVHTQAGVNSREGRVWAWPSRRIRAEEAETERERVVIVAVTAAAAVRALLLALAFDDLEPPLEAALTRGAAESGGTSARSGQSTHQNDGMPA